MCTMQSMILTSHVFLHFGAYLKSSPSTQQQHSKQNKENHRFFFLLILFNLFFDGFQGVLSNLMASQFVCNQHDFSVHGVMPYV